MAKKALCEKRIKSMVLFYHNTLLLPQSDSCKLLTMERGSKAIGICHIFETTSLRACNTTARPQLNANLPINKPLIIIMNSH